MPVVLTAIWWVRAPIGPEISFAKTVGWHRRQGNFSGDDRRNRRLHRRLAPADRGWRSSQCFYLRNTPTIHLTIRSFISFARPAGQRYFLIFLACIFAPVTEGTDVPPGFCIRPHAGRFGWIISAVVVLSLIFAAIHPQGWSGHSGTGINRDRPRGFCAAARFPHRAR